MPRTPPCFVWLGKPCCFTRLRTQILQIQEYQYFISIATGYVEKSEVAHSIMGSNVFRGSNMVEVLEVLKRKRD